MFTPYIQSILIVYEYFNFNVNILIVIMLHLDFDTQYDIQFSNFRFVLYQVNEAKLYENRYRDLNESFISLNPL